MADYDSNLIKPVESLGNIAGLAPAKRRRERRRRRQLPAESAEYDESVADDETISQEEIEDPEDRNSDGIDYCA
jgi:hypothetical protein